MAELQFVFDLADGDKKLYGILQAVDDPAAPVVLFVHGLGGHMREKHLQYCAYAAVEAGFTALRVNLYGAEVDARKLIECTIDTHVDDVTQVLRQIRSSGRKVAIVGHGLGALVMQRLDRSLMDVAVVQDPVDTQTDDFMHWSDVRRNGDTGNWDLLFASDLSVTQGFYDSWWASGPDRHDFTVPARVICAGASDLQDECERYARAQAAPSDLVTIEGADHTFNSKEFREKLFTATTEWLRKQL
jgi:alpha-beta hydrolase superfamily lysophospholipase